MEIRDAIFADENGPMYSYNKKLPKKFQHCKWLNPIIITPRSIGFDTAGLVGYSEDIQKFPFGKLLEFFQDLHKNIAWPGAMCKIKSFPKALEEEFKKCKVEYDDWDYEDWGTSVESKNDIIESEWAEKYGVILYDQPMRSQGFTTPFMSLRITISFW